MEEGGAEKHKVHWRSIEELMGASAPHMPSGVLSRTLTAQLEPSFKGQNGFLYNAGRIMAWAFGVSALIAVTAALVFLLNRHKLEQNALKAHNKMVEIVLSAHRAALAGQREQALWMLRTLRELGTLEPFLEKDILLTEQILLEKKATPVVSKISQQRLRLPPRESFTAAPRAAVKAEIAFKEGVLHVQEGDIQKGCAILYKIIENEQADAVWQEKAAVFVKRKCHNAH